MPVNIGFADVVPGRLELPTSTLSVWRSNQLSYRTGLNRVCVVQEAKGALLRTLVCPCLHYSSHPGPEIRFQALARANAPERRCSSRTFRYGYLVTT